MTHMGTNITSGSSLIHANRSLLVGTVFSFSFSFLFFFLFSNALGQESLYFLQKQLSMLTLVELG